MEIIFLLGIIGTNLLLFACFWMLIELYKQAEKIIQLLKYPPK